MNLGRLFLVCLACSAGAFAADWPQWRGPHRDGISSDRISAKWPAAGPKVLWRATVGTGFSSISVSQGRAYTLGNTTNEDTLWCFDALTGKQLWKHSYPAQLGPQYYEGGPGSTPTVDGSEVFTIGKWGDVFCLDAAKGTVVWQHDLRKDGIVPNRWGFAGSPLIWHGLVILNAGSAGTALDRTTGRLVWCNGTNAAGYASPTLFNLAGQEQVLVFAAKYLFGLDPATGRELWRQFWETGWDTNNPDPCVESNRVFISSFSRGCALLSLQHGRPEVMYGSKVLHNHLSPGVLLGDYLYAFSGEAHMDTDFRCVHLPTGELKWARKDPAFGSLISAEGKLIVLSEKGELLLADASPTEFKPLAGAKVLSGVCWTPPSMANGLLYVRNAKGELHCLDLR
jgi:outer membrane protein assembly factor BamB